MKVSVCTQTDDSTDCSKRQRADRSYAETEGSCAWALHTGKSFARRSLSGKKISPPERKPCVSVYAPLLIAARSLEPTVTTMQPYERLRCRRERSGEMARHREFFGAGGASSGRRVDAHRA